MTRVLEQGPRRGAITAPPSKSVLHRLLLCAALGVRESTILCGALSDDVKATVACLRALGAGVDTPRADTLRITPIRRVPDGVCVLPCAESGSTLRFLLPVAGALGAWAAFRRAGRLPRRSLRALTDELARHGMRFRENGNVLFCKGNLLRSPRNLSLGCCSH